MPKSKRRKRKPDKMKATTDASLPKNQLTQTKQSGVIPNMKGQKSFGKTFGSPKSSRSPISPGKTSRGSARGR